MSLADRLFQSESRSMVNTTHPRDPVLANWFGGGVSSAAGVSVTPETAMQLTAVGGCVRILATATAMLPLKPYRNLPGGGRETARNHPLYNLLRWQPNNWQTSFEWREMMMGHLLLRGNGYNYIVPRGDGAVDAIVPLHPDKTTPFWAPDGKVAYEYIDKDGKSHIYLQHEIFHLRGMSTEGLKGQSVIEHHRETIGLSIAAEQFGGRYFGNGTVVSGVLQTDKELSDPAYERLKKDWASRHQGVSNAHNPAILEDGLKWQALTVNPEDAQFLETRRFQVSEICRIFGVPPHMVAEVSGSTSWGTGIEQQGIGFVVYSLQPWLTRWEQAIRRDLLTGNGSRDLYAEHNVEGLLRGDSAARAEFYRTLFGLGSISQDEIREKENMNPLPNGEGKKYYVPLNMISTDQAARQPAPDVPSGKGADSRDRLRTFHQAQLRQALDKINTCECKAIERALVACGDDIAQLEARLTEFYAAHTDFLRRHLAPVAGDNAPALVGALQQISLRSLQADFASDRPLAHLQETLASWQQSRTDQLAASLSDLALEGILNEE